MFATMASRTTLQLCLLCVAILSSAMLARSFDIRRHLATKTRYAFKVPIPGAPSVHATPDPEGYEPLHLWLLSRHGTRWPTKDRMRQIDTLEGLFKDATNVEQHPWIKEWQSPVKDMVMASGELHAVGEDEMWALAHRLRTRFPKLVSARYYPKRYNIASTQVARAAASASAFALGLFPEARPVPEAENQAHVEAAMQTSREWRRRLRVDHAAHIDQGLQRTLALQAGGIRPQAVAITMAPKHKDPLLRFYEMCPAYAEQELYTESWMAPWMASNWTKLTPRLEARLRMTRQMDPCEVEALWQLCLMEAGLHGELGRACSLFTPEEVGLMEWVDDVELMESHGYGAKVNYQIAAPLLHDMLSNIKDAASHKKPVQQARLLFAHCETLVPLAALMGLFKEPAMGTAAGAGAGTASRSAAAAAAAVPEAAAGQVTESMALLQEMDAVEDLALHMSRAQRGAARDEDINTCSGKHRPSGPAPDPPAGWQPSVPYDDNRLWRGARIAPYGANMAVVLYRAIKGSTARSSHRVRLVYNEQVIPVPGCTSGSGEGSGEALDCDLEEFLALYADRADPDIMTRTCAVQGLDMAAAA